MERRNLLLANNISIGLSFGFFTDVDKKLGFSRPPWTPPRGKEYSSEAFAAQEPAKLSGRCQ
jgi:hypothetical protein